MADLYRQGEQPQDGRERPQSERQDRAPRGSEGKYEPRHWGEGGYDAEGRGSQNQGSQMGYRSHQYGQASQRHRFQEDASERYGEGSEAYGTQRYDQGAQGYGGQQSSYEGYGAQSGQGRWRPSSYDVQQTGRAGYGSQPNYGGARPGNQAFAPDAGAGREAGGPEHGGSYGPQPGHRVYGPQGGYGTGQRLDYGGYQSPGGYDAGVGWRRGYSLGGYGPSGERVDYTEYRLQGGYDAGWQSGYGQQGRMRRRGPKGYKRSDERIREDLCERLMQADVDASDVTVDVNAGRVILRGSVPERRMKHRIEDIADECFGVDDVENDLRVARQQAWEGSPPGRAGTEYDSNALNRCLRSELSAIETYRQALDRDRIQYGAHDEFQRLAQIQREHDDAAVRLRQLIRNIGGEPSSDSGAWGTWSKVVMGAAKLFGDKSALKALKEGEESGLAEYQRYLREFAGSTEAVRLTSELIERQQRHIRELDRLLAAAD